MWPVLDKALEFVLRFQRDDGAVLWSVDPDGHPGRYPLLTGSSSIYHALRCGVACAETLGDERPDWELAAGRLAHTIAHAPEVFEPKHEFAMDWYYPVLSGALSGEAAAARIDAWWDTFVMDGRGVRCVSTGPWVTAAETAECALALDAVGRRQRGAGPAHLDPGPSPRRRFVLDGDRLSRDGDVPLRRAHHLHRRRHRAGRRRPVQRHAGGGPVPGRVAAGLARPHRAPVGGATRLSTRSDPHSPSSTNSPDSSAAHHSS